MAKYIYKIISTNRIYISNSSNNKI